MMNQIEALALAGVALQALANLGNEDAGDAEVIIRDMEYAMVRRKSLRKKARQVAQGDTNE